MMIIATGQRNATLIKSGFLISFCNIANDSCLLICYRNLNYTSAHYYINLPLQAAKNESL